MQEGAEKEKNNTNEGGMMKENNAHTDKRVGGTGGVILYSIIRAAAGLA